MSRLVLLGGPVGVGKSTVMRALKKRIPKVGLVDADEIWCVSDDLSAQESRSYAHDNVNAVIAGYARAGVETCVVNWVFARKALYQPIVDEVGRLFDEVLQVYLIATPEILEVRIRQRWLQQGNGFDVDDLTRYALSRLQLIQALPFDKIDTSTLSVDQVAEALVAYLDNPVG